MLAALIEYCTENPEKIGRGALRQQSTRTAKVGDTSMAHITTMPTHASIPVIGEKACSTAVRTNDPDTPTAAANSDLRTDALWRKETSEAKVGLIIPSFAHISTVCRCTADCTGHRK